MAIKKTVEERVAILDAKIAKKQEEINNLEAQRQKLLHPINMKTVMAKAKESGMTPEEIAEKLGLEI
jgi:cell division protein FtsL